MSLVDTSPLALRRELAGTSERRVSVGPQFELREVPNGTGGTNLRFTGFASVTEVEYEMWDPFGPFTEIIAKGAFRDSINTGADMVFLCNHAGMSLARVKSGTLMVREVLDGPTSPVPGVTGLWCEALLDPANHYVQAIRSAVERNDLDEMSFAFKVPAKGDSWSPDYMVRTIHRTDLAGGDCSIVNFGANPHTGGTVSLRQRFTGGRLAGRDNIVTDTRGCDSCGGTGKLAVSCPSCDGTGKIHESNTPRTRPAAGLLSPLPAPDFRADRARLEALRHPARRP